MKNHFSRTFSLFSPILCKIFFKKSKVQIFLLARAIHREHFLLHCLKKEIATTKELDLRQLGKVLIFRDRQTHRTFLLYIDEDDDGHGDKCGGEGDGGENVGDDNNTQRKC